MAVSQRDEDAEIVRDASGKPMPDPKLRDTEQVPLLQVVEDYFDREVAPHLPLAWIEHSKTKVGYEIPFTRHFHQYAAPRELAEIDKDLNRLIGEISLMLEQIEQ